MRRPRFKNWARAELLRLTNRTSFNLRKMAEAAQSSDDLAIRSTLLLYAHETGNLDRLLRLIDDPELKREYLDTEQHLGKRSVEGLALRGMPMMSIGESYRDVFTAYEQAYYAPELADQEKQQIQQRTLEAMQASKLTPAEIAHSLALDQANLHAFLVRGKTERFTLDTARKIERFVIDWVDN